MSGWDQPYDIENHERDLAAQLHREHREGMAEERLEAERRKFDWDIEGWSSTDQLLLYIAGSGLHRIPADEVVRLANAMLAEHQIRFYPDRQVDYGYEERCRRAASRQGLDEPRRILTEAGFTVGLEQTGGYVMLLSVPASNDEWVWLSVDGDDDEPYLICRYRADDEEAIAEDYAGPRNLVEKMRELIA